MKNWRSELAPAPNIETTAWRIYNNAKAGIWIDNFAGRWLVQTRDETVPDFLSEAVTTGVANSLYWKPRDRSAKTEPELIAGKRVTRRFSIRESGVECWIDFSSGYSSGIFLDQRLNRERVAERCRKGDRVLNTFSYTSIFSVAAAKSGAITSSLDLSQTYLDWSKENFKLNAVDPKQQFFCKGDTFEWLATFARQGRTFHGVILDPPTFSRNKKVNFRTDRDYAKLAKLAAAVVEPGGWLLACANTFRMNFREFREQVESGIKSAKRETSRLERLRMPPEFHGENYLKSAWVDFK